MSDVSSQLQHLIDKDAIRDVLNGIARGVDRFDGGLLGACIHDDAVLDMGGATTMTGAAFAQALKPPEVPPSGRMHILGNVWIEVAADTARSESHIVSCQQLEAGGQTATRFRAGRYLDRFERRDGVWKLSARTLIDEWGRTDPVCDCVPRGRHAGQPAPHDLVYRRPELDHLP